MATWNFDPAHTSAGFAVRHMMVATVRSEFRGVSGKLEFDPENIAAASVEATIDVKSMASTGVEDRDNHLLSADFLDAEKFPTITFKSTRVEPTCDKTAKVHGDLTIRGVTKPVVIDAEFLGQGTTPYGTKVAGFEGTTRFNREDFGLTWNMALETGGFLVGKDVKVSLSVEAVLQEAAATA